MPEREIKSDCKTRGHILRRFEPGRGLGAGRVAARADSTERRGQPIQPHSHSGGDNLPNGQEQAPNPYRALARGDGARPEFGRSVGAGAHHRQAEAQGEDGTPRRHADEQGQRCDLGFLRVGGRNGQGGELLSIHRAFSDLAAENALFELKIAEETARRLFIRSSYR